MSEYLELYKKYRPKKWEDFVGQEKVIKSLQNSIKNNKVPTVYIFSGQGGSGKTSAALLLSKALNCENVDENANPCDNCSVCSSINNSTERGVNYLSMAQDGSVENVRKLMTQARLQSDLKVQVFILDEAHNMSRQSFESALIPFEDEKMKSLFILSTTEINKFPLTITSRAQLRDFNVVSKENIEKKLNEIAKKENILIDNQSLQKIINNSHGSVRQAISLLDSYSMGDTKTINNTPNLLQFIPDADLLGALETINQAYNDGEDMFILMEKTYLDAEFLLMLGNGKENKDYYINVPNPEELYQKLYKDNGIIFIMNEILSGCDRVKFINSDARAQISMVFMKIMDKYKKAKLKHNS